MFDTIAPRYDLVNRLMTFGLDAGWRRRTVRLLGLAPGSLVLDLACGTGDLARELRSQRLRAFGADLSFGMLAAARPGAAPLVEADGAALPLADGVLDGVVSGFALRNFAELAATLGEIARVLRPGGRIGLLDVDSPSSPLLALGHRIWFQQAVPRIGAALSDSAAYRYLPRSVAYLPPRAELLALIRAAGFENVTHTRLGGGVVQVVSGTRVGAVPLAAPRAAKR